MTKKMRRVYSIGLTSLIVALIATLFLLSNATENTAAFRRYFDVLLTLTVAGLILLLLIVSIEVYRLLGAYRRHELGVILRGKLMLIIAMLAMAPAAMVYYVSNQFLQRGIDSWVNVEIEQALENALELSQTALNAQRRDINRQLARAVSSINLSDADLQRQLSRAYQQTDALYLDLFETSGYLLATASYDTNRRVPQYPGSVLSAFSTFPQTQFSLEQSTAYGLGFRAVRVISGPRSAVLQGFFPVDDEQALLADEVSTSYDRYRELDFLKSPLKRTFSLVLLFVVFFAVLVGVLFALRASARITKPIITLARGTRSVAAGDYSRQLAVESGDELGELVSSFNSMTKSLSDTRQKLFANQQFIEQQNQFLATIMQRLSSGVITLGENGILFDANDAAEKILGYSLKPMIGSNISALVQAQCHLNEPSVDELQQNKSQPSEPSESDVAIVFPEHVLTFLTRILDKSSDASYWSQEVRLTKGHNRLILLTKGSRVSMPYQDQYEQGHIIVFDDISGLVVAQRSAAWGEVAQRLAHEVKNPLTPIQLAAERLQRKLGEDLSPDKADFLNKSVDVISRQVSSLKDIVSEFSDFARTSVISPKHASLGDLVEEVHYLYEVANPKVNMSLEQAQQIPAVNMDIRRIRQVLNNLYKNAIEAMDRVNPAQLHVQIFNTQYSGEQWVTVTIEDAGPGFSNDTGVDYFEPYVTKKSKGTGLGLAVVKKIIEEHQGFIDIGASDTLGGAKMIINLPSVKQ